MFPFEFGIAVADLEDAQADEGDCGPRFKVRKACDLSCADVIGGTFAKHMCNAGSHRKSQVRVSTVLVI